MTTTHRWRPDQVKALAKAKTKMPPDGVSPDEIEAAKTNKGAWTKATLAKWGVPWPPPQGWKAELESRYYSANPDKLSRRIEVRIDSVEQTTKTVTLLSAEDLRRLEFNRAVRELQWIRHKYRDLPELGDLFSRVDETLAQFEARTADAIERQLDRVDWRSA